MAGARLVSHLLLKAEDTKGALRCSPPSFTFSNKPDIQPRKATVSRTDEFLPLAHGQQQATQLTPLGTCPAPLRGAEEKEQRSLRVLRFATLRGKDCGIIMATHDTKQAERARGPDVGHTGCVFCAATALVHRSR